MKITRGKRMQNPEDLLRRWRNESRRVFANDATEHENEAVGV
jgi:hypothetical protein